MTARSSGPPNRSPKPDPSDQYDPAEEEDEQEPEETAEAEETDAGAQLRSQEAAKYRVRAKKAEERVAQLEARIAELEASAGNDELQAENQELRIGNAFLEEAAGKFTDLGAAYKLLDRALIDVSVEGEVTGMRDAVATIANRYPFLVVEEGKPVRPSPTRKERQVLRSTANVGLGTA